LQPDCAIVLGSSLAYIATCSMESAAFDPDSKERWSEQGEEEDNYDPRNPDYILPASTVQVEEINVAMFEQQICRLQGAISHRENEDEQHLLEHYRRVLFHLQCSLQAALDRRDRTKICGDSDNADAKSGLIVVPVLHSEPYFHPEHGSNTMCL